MPTCLPVGCSPPWAPSPPNIAEYSPKVPRTLLLFWLKVRNDDLGLQKWGRRLSPGDHHVATSPGCRAMRRGRVHPRSLRVSPCPPL